MTLAPRVAARIAARAAAAPAGRPGRTFSGQIAVLLDEAEDKARTLRLVLGGDVGAILGDCARLLEGGYVLPANRERVERIRRHADRMRRVLTAAADARPPPPTPAGPR